MPEATRFSLFDWLAYKKPEPKPYSAPVELVQELQSLPLVHRLLADHTLVAFRPSFTVLTEDQKNDSGNWFVFPGGLGVAKNDPKAENAELWKKSLIRGATLHGESRIEHALQAFNESDNVLVTIARFGDAMCGHQGLVHGGLISAFFDDQFGTLFSLFSKGESGVTANLNVNYRAPMPAPQNVAFVIWIDKTEGRKVFLKGEARSIPTQESDNGSSTNDENASVGDKYIPGSIKFAEATALFIKVKQDQLDKMKQRQQ
ncbi:HotDog domain-containing protein [Obelidium mucronatum]|nr:HotDog domain-containing protein [Obelidium mucronatum]